MTEVPLLTHAGEQALARRLERADLALVRALLATEPGREVLADVALALREGESRIEDVQRNPEREGEGAVSLAERIERVVAQAAARTSGHPRTRPRAHGLRLHPRTVRKIEQELAEALARDPRDRALARTVADVESAREKADKATTELVTANFRIVVTFARRYRGMPLVDLIQEGNLGLLRAVDKFDHRRGLRFSTYAAWWMRHALTRALADQSKMIRLPVHLTGTISRLRRAQERMLRESGTSPTYEELAAKTGIPLEHVKRALDTVAQPLSLDTPLSSDRDAADLGELVADTSEPSAEEAVAETELKREARELLAELPEREAEVLRLRYGFGGTGPRTLEEVGSRLSLSRERARQLERDALRKLRVSSEKRRVRDHIG